MNFRIIIERGQKLKKVSDPFVIPYSTALSVAQIIRSESPIYRGQ